MNPLTNHRTKIRKTGRASEADVVGHLMQVAALQPSQRAAIVERAVDLVRAVRAQGTTTMMESFLAEYGLSTKEGIALMCLAEALLRVPDPETIDDLIRDKISPGNWGKHLGHSSSSLVNASTWALLLTGRVIAEPEGDDGLAAVLRGAVRRLGEPVVRTAVSTAMRELGEQFVLGRSIEEALKRGDAMVAKGYTYSYDMLGEAARTAADATHYFDQYAAAIRAIAPRAKSRDIRENPGISVKLSALHPRYEFGQRRSVLEEMVPRVRDLAVMARDAGMGFNIDAEEADRLDLSLDVIEAVLSDDELAGWDGFGIVVQAFGPRAMPVLDWIEALAKQRDRRLMVRLVKGAYWDSEIKRAQVLGLDTYPVFTRKVNTDVSYIACARRLLEMGERIYPQFATHNAHTAAAILTMGARPEAFEFQRLHGMGEALHEIVKQKNGTRCRIYAPVGEHEDLLAYLVRRLLENGANSSFVNQIVDTSVPAKDVASDPFAAVEALGEEAIVNPKIAHPSTIFGADRVNAKGWDITDADTVDALREARNAFSHQQWRAAPMLAAGGSSLGEAREVVNPARPTDVVGWVQDATAEDIDAAFTAAQEAFAAWSARPVAERAEIVRAVADHYEAHAAELMALAAREAGKTWLDGVGEVREAVDFCRYYANEAKRYAAQGRASGRGVFVCVSPWNFPLAIFTGQITAALAAGNAVIAKPAEQTSLIAGRAVELMRQAGLPEGVLQLLPGDGPSVGARLVADPRLAGICFTGSTETAQRINRAMAEKTAPDAPLIAETGGLNAMIVDSSALPEQAVRDILASAFQSAGQRCSALRLLYVQADVQERVLTMLTGAMEALRIGDPWQLSTDVGPVIDAAAWKEIETYRQQMRSAGREIKTLQEVTPGDSHFVAPSVYRVDGIADLEREVFGPILHVASFEADDIDKVLDQVNAAGYGLTFGIHTRVDHRVQRAVERARVGNIYVNRNQIGAVVGSQPFGGEGLSGTGPKAGGPHYLSRFLAGEKQPQQGTSGGRLGGTRLAAATLQAALDTLAKQPSAEPGAHAKSLATLLNKLPGSMAQAARQAIDLAAVLDPGPRDLPGPTGESNRLSLHPRGSILCLGAATAMDDGLSALCQAMQALSFGNPVVIAAAGTGWLAALGKGLDLPLEIIDGTVNPDHLQRLRHLDGLYLQGNAETLRPYRVALAARDGALVPLITDLNAVEQLVVERTVCIDTTASGGNASLLAANE